VKIVYTLPVRQGVAVPVPPGTAGGVLDGVAFSWQLSEGVHLSALVLQFTGAQVRYNENGAIVPTYPEVEETAYRIANYLSNRVFVQTGYDPIDAEHVFAEAPVNSPEGAAEVELFRTKYKAIWKVLPLGWATHGAFDPSAYAGGFAHSAAHGYYADALRAASEFQQFELLYKVVEYFFADDGAALDAAVSAHVTPFDPTFDAPTVEWLRQLRNRAVHPRARKGHVKPENIAHVREVHAALPLMRHLADTLLAHPTF
jgi:hypothetical protein